MTAAWSGSPSVPSCTSSATSRGTSSRAESVSSSWRQSGSPAPTETPAPKKRQSRSAAASWASWAAAAWRRGPSLSSQPRESSRRCACAAENIRSVFTTSATSTSCAATKASRSPSNAVSISPEVARAPPLPVPMTGIDSTCFARPQRGGSPRACRSWYAPLRNCEAASRNHASSGGLSAPSRRRSGGAKRPSRWPSQITCPQAAAPPSRRITRREGVNASRAGGSQPLGGPRGNHLGLLVLRVGSSRASDESSHKLPCTTNTCVRRSDL